MGLNNSFLGLECLNLFRGKAGGLGNDGDIGSKVLQGFRHLCLLLGASFGASLCTSFRTTFCASFCTTLCKTFFKTFCTTLCTTFFKTFCTTFFHSFS